MSTSDVTVVIRAAGERTEQLCKHIVEAQVLPEHIHIVKERPFTQAVKKTFEIGLENSRSWTLAIDADVLISPDTITSMINSAESLGEHLYVYQGFVVDKIFGRARAGGPHLYNTKHLSKALSVLSGNPSTFRPESDTYAALAEEGYLKYGDNKIYGVHDYFQYHRDLYRKAFFHSKKHFKPHYTHNFIEHWKAHKSNDADYLTILHGWFEGVLTNDLIQNDISFFEQITTRKLPILNIDEKKLIVRSEFKAIEADVADLVNNSNKKNLYKYISPKPPVIDNQQSLNRPSLRQRSVNLINLVRRKIMF
jgi:hypothetical protein